ncbi:uncharacterized protein [Leishmania mexicana MHOM/GT/2001/U1103]|uniref:Uncharacterized protein n=1 Tax=Leishmania mexicana (strain MHOM/GT/2001/U1103) TaxID=929439 RepID=E9AJK3_LEIMU|nr:uncharacterized protein [Leishmania mexicana MHOM/GT/2001/U1103]CBZ23101.1 unnamed protein product [Leishmania mexicana MHOM/GT/2001/U1103]
MSARALLHLMLLLLLLLLLLSPMQPFTSLLLRRFSIKLCHSAIFLPVLKALLLQLSPGR